MRPPCAASHCPDPQFSPSAALSPSSDTSWHPSRFPITARLRQDVLSGRRVLEQGPVTLSPSAGNRPRPPPTPFVRGRGRGSGAP